ncbi:unnamed protein product, partial [Vitis vinifera]
MDQIELILLICQGLYITTICRIQTTSSIQRTGESRSRAPFTGYVKIPEVEFPDVALAGAKIGKITVGVRDCKADLDEVKDVDIGLEEDVVDGRGRLRGMIDDENRSVLSAKLKPVPLHPPIIIIYYSNIL